MCRINPGAFDNARAWLEVHERFWSDRLNALDRLVGSGTGSKSR